MTTNEVLDAFRERSVDIACNNSEERQAVIQLLLDHGFQHGSSGYSEHMLRDVEWHPDEYLIISTIGYSLGLEFYRRRSPRPIVKGDHLVNLLCAASPQVDDLL